MRDRRPRDITSYVLFCAVIFAVAVISALVAMVLITIDSFEGPGHSLSGKVFLSGATAAIFLAIYCIGKVLYRAIFIWRLDE